MNNQQLFDQLIASYDNNDNEAFLTLLAPDFEWHMVGDQVIAGREGVEKLFAQMEGNFRVISNTWESKLLDGDKAACSGTTIVEEDGVVMKRLFCNVYVFRNQQLKKMSTYTIKKEDHEGEVIG